MFTLLKALEICSQENARYGNASRPRVVDINGKKTRIYLGDAPTCYQIVSTLSKYSNIAILDPYMSREKSGTESQL